jgi:hypothetical protein
LRYLTNAVKKRSIAFLLSDFMDKGYNDPLKDFQPQARYGRHPHVHDVLEAEIPNVGLLPLTDAETRRNGLAEHLQPTGTHPP